MRVRWGAFIADDTAARLKVLFGGMQPLRVLVIEDDALIAMLLAEVLSGMDIRFVPPLARQPRQSLRLARKIPILCSRM